MSSTFQSGSDTERRRRSMDVAAGRERRRSSAFPNAFNRRVSVAQGELQATLQMPAETLTEGVYNAMQRRASVHRGLNEKKQAELKAQKQDSIIDPIGLIAVHVKMVDIASLECEKLFDRIDCNVYLRLFINGMTKCSTIFEYVKPPAKVVFDDIKHFCVKPSQKRGDPVNFLRIELIVYNPDRPRHHRVLTAREIPIFNLIKHLYLVETIEMRTVQKLLATVEVEFCFSYGQFGYGMCNQFDNNQKTPKDQLAHSMFCRLGSDSEDRYDPINDIIRPVPVGHPSFINFTNEATIGNITDEFHNDMESGEYRTIEEPVLLISKIRKRMHALMVEYSRKGKRQDRVAFLKRLVNGSYGVCASQKFEEEFMVPKNYKLRRRSYRRPIKDQDDGNVFEMDLLNKVLGTAPGIVRRVKRWAGGPADEDDEGEQSGSQPMHLAVAGISQAMRRMSTAVTGLPGNLSTAVSGLPGTLSTAVSGIPGTLSAAVPDAVSNLPSNLGSALLNLPNTLGVAKSWNFLRSRSNVIAEDLEEEEEEEEDEDVTVYAGVPPPLIISPSIEDGGQHPPLMKGGIMTRMQMAMKEIEEQDAIFDRIVNIPDDSVKDSESPSCSCADGEEVEEREESVDDLGELSKQIEKRALRQQLASLGTARARRLSVDLHNLMTLTAQPLPGTQPEEDKDEDELTSQCSQDHSEDLQSEQQQSEESEETPPKMEQPRGGVRRFSLFGGGPAEPAGRRRFSLFGAKSTDPPEVIEMEETQQEVSNEQLINKTRKISFFGGGRIGPSGAAAPPRGRRRLSMFGFGGDNDKEVDAQSVKSSFTVLDEKADSEMKVGGAAPTSPPGRRFSLLGGGQPEDGAAPQGIRQYMRRASSIVQGGLPSPQLDKLRAILAAKERKIPRVMITPCTPEISEDEDDDSDDVSSTGDEGSDSALFNM